MSGNRVPYFNFYPTDFMRGVRGLTPQEVGIYTMLLCLIYEHNGPVKMNVARLSAYCGCRPTTLQKAVDRLIELGRILVDDDMLMDDRAAKEIDKRQHALKLQSRAGEKSAEIRKQNQGTDATGVQRAFNHTDTDKDKYSEAKASGGEAPAAKAVGDDFAKQLFDRSVDFLGRHGTKESAARSFVGKLRKDHPDTAIFDAFAACSKAGAVDPIPWITARLVKPKTNAEMMDAAFAALKQGNPQ